MLRLGFAPNTPLRRYSGVGSEPVNRMIRTVASSTASGVLGWIALIAMFEAAYWGQAWLTDRKRKRGG